MQPSDPARSVPPLAIRPAPAFAPRQRGRAAPAAPAAGHGAQRAPLGRRTAIVSSGPDPQKRARAITRRYKLQDKAAELLPSHRVSWCARHPVGDTVSVVYHPEHKSSSYAGLAVCGSVWVCPLCGAKIAARRAAEITAGATSWAQRGGELLMLTLTIRHQRGQPLAFLLRAINSAYRRIRQGRRFIAFRELYGLRGTITAREITQGKNGWHPHLHALLFVEHYLTDLEIEHMRKWIHESWTKALKKAGLNATYEHGVKITRAEAGGVDYIAKVGGTWSLSQELVKGLAKEGRMGNRTPAQLLALAELGDKRAAKLYREYAAATHGLNMIVWSPGLRALILPDEQELSDQELAEESMSDGIELIVLTAGQWQKVVRHKFRADILAEACSGDADHIYAYCQSIGLMLAQWQLTLRVRERRRDSENASVRQPQMQGPAGAAGGTGPAPAVLFTQLSIEDGTGA